VLHRDEQDVGFWRELALDCGGPVLELACGTGRITWALAAAGVEVVGLDHDPAMLAAARQRRLSSTPPLWVTADMRRFALARRFSLVFVGYNSVQLLTGPGDISACLCQAREHLAPGGHLGLEVTDFQVGGADGDSGALVPLGEAEGIRLSGALVHDLATRTSRYHRRFEGPRWVIEDEVVVRSLGQTELTALIEDAGFRVAQRGTQGTTVRAVARPAGPTR